MTQPEWTPAAADESGRPTDPADVADPLLVARYTNLAAFPLFQRFPLTDRTHRTVLAEMTSVSVAQASTMLDDLAAEARASFAQLLGDAGVIEALSSLPFPDGARVLTVGDSITADRLGWAELLSLAADESGAFTVINMAFGGQTSADMISQIDLYADLEPDWILLMIGTNDFRFHAETIRATMLSSSETQRNLLLVRQLLEQELGARLVAITPPPVVKPGVSVGTGARAIGWHPEHDAALAEFIRSEFAMHIDVHGVLAEAGADGLYEEDGIHPSAQGQRLILRTMLQRLTSIGSRRAVADAVGTFAAEPPQPSGSQ